MVLEIFSTLSTTFTTLLSVIGMAIVLGYLASLAHFKLQLTITNCRNIKGCRRNVYRVAAANQGFYTTHEQFESIKYVYDDLVVCVAFTTHRDRVGFVEGLQSWNDMYKDMVGDPMMSTGFGFLGYDRTILSRHYLAEGSSSPDAPSSARSVETSTTVNLAADWDTKTHQNISPLKLVAGCGLQMCRIKYNRLCTKKEANEPFVAQAVRWTRTGLDPNRGHSTLKTHTEQVEVATECGGLELRTRIDLRVKFLSLEAFDGCDGVLKDGSYKMNDDDPTIWVISVYVLDPESFNKYVEFKSAQTLRMWDV